MGLIADSKYYGVVGAGSRLQESQNGSLGFFIPIQCSDGDTSYTIWLTAKNKKNALKYFRALDISEEQLKNPKFVEYELPVAIQGKEIAFGTSSNEYNGKTRVQVNWIGKRSAADGEGGLSKAAASYFGGAAVEIDDDDIPF